MVTIRASQSCRHSSVDIVSSHVQERRIIGVIIMLCKGFVIIILLVIRTAFSIANGHTSASDVVEFHPVEDLERRIVSKSIFIAPIFRKCPDGYVLDLQGQCYRLIRVDEQAHWNSLAAQLSKFYENVREMSKIPTTVTLPQPVEYQIINIDRDIPNILNNRLSEARNEPLQFQLPIPIARTQQSN